MNAIDLGLIVELGSWRNSFSQDEDHDRLQRVHILGQQLLERTAEQGLTSKGICH
jgi:hypothetical protein